MEKKSVILCLLFCFLCISVKSQIKFKAQVGVGYIEHFSIGLAISKSDKNILSLNYGSDFFIKMNDFSSFLLQYERLFNKMNIKSIVPKIGIKGGYSIYTNAYYKWELIALIPYVGLYYPFNEKIQFNLDAGLAVSKELSIERISYGEIGNYKKYLPEIKLGFYYNL